MRAYKKDYLQDVEYKQTKELMALLIDLPLEWWALEEEKDIEGQQLVVEAFHKAITELERRNVVASLSWEGMLPIGLIPEPYQSDIVRRIGENHPFGQWYYVPDDLGRKVMGVDWKPQPFDDTKYEKRVT